MSTGLVPGQVVVGVAVLGCAFLAASLAVVLVFMVAAVVAWRRDKRHDVGPDQLRLLQTLDKELDSDPEVRAGFARLDAAIRGEQQEGESV